MLRHNGNVPSPISDPADSQQEQTRTPWREQPRWLRRVTYAALTLLLVVVGFVVAGAVVIRLPLPDTEGDLKLTGLTSEVKVLRNGQGVPQIYAENTDDLFFAQGFVQAQDRFWQMDVGRHLGSGRLSELFGASTLKSDELVRAMGWRNVAEQEYALLAPETRDYLAAFADGVNTYLAGHSPTTMSVEYTLLGLSGLDYEPAKWTPVDSLVWMKALAWELRANLDDEIDRANLEPRLSEAQLGELYPDAPATNQPIMNWPPLVSLPVSAPPGQSLSRRPAAQAHPSSWPKPATRPEPATNTLGLDAIPSLFGKGEGIGSNSFVVSGRNTDTGKPYLENDPHLTATQPGVWYQLGLHCTKVSATCPFEVSGYTMAGFPGVMIGQNQDIAWALTNMRADVSDLYLEKIEGQSALYDGEFIPLERHDEVIRVRGRESKVFTVRATRHGPLLSDISAELSSVGANAAIPESLSARRPVTPAPERGNGFAVAIAWTGLTPRPTADAIFRLDTATDFADLREAAKRMAAPAMNILYADVAGNIGYQAPGDIPIRNWGNTGMAPVPGWDPSFDWIGLIDFDRLPSVLNPAEGFIVAANQAPVPAGYPHLLGSSFDYGWRAQRIRDLLQTRISHGKVSMADMLRISSDTRNPLAEKLTPMLLRQIMTSAYYADGQRLLVDWDYKQPKRSGAAAYFNVVWSNILRLTFHDQLPESQWPTGGDRWIAVVDKLLDDDYSPWWDDVNTPHIVEDRDTILAEAMRKARDELTRTQSVGVGQWHWGRSHRLEMTSPVLGQRDNALLDALLNRGPYPVAGGNAAVLSTNWDATKGYAMTSGPSMRMVVDLADPDRSRWVNVAGQSGHVGSGQYVDQVKLWAEGLVLPWAVSQAAIKKQATAELTLKPKG